MAQVRITHQDGTVDTVNANASQRINVQQGDKIEVLDATLAAATVEGNDYVVTLLDDDGATIQITFVDLFLLLAVGDPDTTPAETTSLVVGDTEIASIGDALAQVATAAGPGAGGAVDGGLGDQARSGGSREAPEEFQAPDLGAPEAPKGPLQQDFPSDEFPADDPVVPDDSGPGNQPPTAFSFTVDADFSDDEGGEFEGQGLTALFDLGGSNDGISIGGSDPEDGLTTTYKIASLPSDGTLWADLDQNGTYETQLQVGDVLTADSDDLADNVLYVAETIPQDGKDEFTYTTTDSQGAVSSPATVTIDFPGTTVSVDNADISDGNAFENPSLPGDDSLVFTVSLADPLGGDVKVFFTLGGDATAGTDYSTAGLTSEGGGVFSVVIPAGATSAQIELPISDDSDVEVSPESVDVTLTGTDNTNVTINDGLGEGTITDLNGTISVSDAGSVSEGGDLVYNVTLNLTSGSLAGSETVVVPLTYGGTADAADIVGGLPGSVTLTEQSEGVWTGTITLETVSGDGLEGDETLTVDVADSVVTVDGVVAEGISGDDATGTITESVTVSVDDAAVSGGNAFENPSLPGDDSLTFTVSMSETNTTSGDVKVYFTLGGAATAGSDYDISGLSVETTGPNTGDFFVTIANGTSSQTFTLPVEDDAVVEASPESVDVTLTGTDNGGVTIGDGLGEGTITDLNGTVTVSDAGTVSEGDDLVYNVTLNLTSGSLAGSETVVVPLTFGGTADAADIVGGFPGSVTLTEQSEGVWTGTVTLETVSGDGLEGDETLTVSVADSVVTVDGVVAEGISGDNATGTITESITASVDDADVSGGNAFENPSLPGDDSLTFTVSMNETNTTGGDVRVYFTLGGGATAGSDYDTSGLSVETTGPNTGDFFVTIANGTSSQTFTLPVEDDAVVEASPESVVVTLTGTDNVNVLASDIGTATITDLNGTITIADATSVTEGGDLVYNVTLNLTSGSVADSETVVVPLTFGGTADAADIVGGFPGSVTLTEQSEGVWTGTVTLETMSGDGAEGNETVTVTAADSVVTVDGVVAEGISGDDATGTILDGNTTPTAETPGAVAHDETAGLQDADIAAPGGLVTSAGTAAGQALTAIGAVTQSLSFDVGADDGPAASLALDGSVDSTLVTGLTMTETAKPVYYYVDGDGLVLGVTVTNGANVGDGIAQGEIEDVVFSMHLSTTDPSAGTATYTFIQYEAVVHDAGGASHNEALSSQITIDYIVTDQDGESASATITTDILDDGPNNIDPMLAIVSNSGTNSGSGALDFFGNGGNDQPGDVTFANITNGDQLLDSGDAPVTSGGSDIFVFVSGDGHTLTASTDATNADAGAVVFTVTLNPDGSVEGQDAYTIEFLQKLDDGSVSVFDDFSNAPAGQKKWVGLDSNDIDLDDFDPDPNSEDLLITTTDNGTINTSSTDIGNSNQWIDPAEGIRLDLVTGVNRDAPNDESDVDGFTFNGHYNASRFDFTVQQVQGGGTAAIMLAVFLDPGGNTAVGDGAAVNIDASSVVVTNLAGTDVTGSVTITESGDAVIIEGVDEGWTVSFIADSTFNSVQITNADDGGAIDGSPFAIGGFEFSSFSDGDQIDMDFDLAVTDGDGDSASGSLEIAVVPEGMTLDASGEAEGTALIGGANDDMIIGSSFDDVIDGGDGNDTIDGGAGLDSFVYNNESDTLNDVDTILNFNAGQDTFDFSALTGDLADVTFSTSGDGDIVVEINGNSAAELDSTAGFASVEVAAESTVDEVALTIV